MSAVFGQMVCRNPDSTLSTLWCGNHVDRKTRPTMDSKTHALTTKNFKGHQA